MIDAIAVICLLQNKLSYFLSLFPIQTGRQTKTANKENSKPPIEPAANENQKISLSPSVRKGTKPKTVESVVSRIGNALDFTASTMR
jgi:hypothetical protein